MDEVEKGFVLKPEHIQEAYERLAKRCGADNLPTYTPEWVAQVTELEELVRKRTV